MSLRPATVLTGSFMGVFALALAATPAQADQPTPTSATPTASVTPAHQHSNVMETSLAGLAGKADPASQATTKQGNATAPRVVAHRGASAYAPENTLAGVDKANDLNIEWVENDVQRTSDGELVVMHDETLERTTDAEEIFPDRSPWKVGDFTAEEIAQLDAGSWFAPEFAGERVPTLEKFLERMTRNDQKLLLELKKPELFSGIEREVVGELRDKGWLAEDKREGLSIQSFNADSVRTVHELAPSVTTGFLGTPAVSELSAYAQFTDQINPRYTEVTTEYVDAVKALRGAHGAPLEVFTWTVDDAQDAERVAALGVDGIISNRPDVIRDAVATQGDSEA